MLIAPLFSAGVVLLAADVSAGVDSNQTRLDGAAYKCIDENAARVELYEPKLNDAVAFVVDSLCVQEVTAATRYRVSTEQLRQRRKALVDYQDDPDKTKAENLREREKAAQERLAVEKATIDADTGELRLDEPPATSGESMLAAASEIVFSGTFLAAAGSPEFRAHAARAVLAARAARLGSQTSK
jgi:hypothetical protein